MKPSDLENYRKKISQPTSEGKNESPKKEKREDMIESTLMFRKHYHVSLMVAMITMGSVALFGYLGYRLDLFLGTKNAFLVLGLLFSFPFSQFALYKWVKEKYIPSVKKLHKKK